MNLSLFTIPEEEVEEKLTKYAKNYNLNYLMDALSFENEIQRFLKKDAHLSVMKSPLKQTEFLLFYTTSLKNESYRSVLGKITFTVTEKMKIVLFKEEDITYYHKIRLRLLLA